MFDVGCVSTILQMLKLPDGTVKVWSKASSAPWSSPSRTANPTLWLRHAGDPQFQSRSDASSEIEACAVP
jgi:hypothetical protein